ncbi:MAG: hypothetical protein J7639_06550 [Paenibacillaceae bacterium]|nr:hypothetical protein [Paenibacillaceae bacterium]
MQKIVAINNDAFDVILAAGPYECAADIGKPLEPFRGKGVAIYEWNTYLGTKANYLTKRYERFGLGERVNWEQCRRMDKQIADFLARCESDGTDPLDTVIATCRELGMSPHASVRMNSDYNAGWMGQWLPDTFNETWYFEHPEYLLEQRDGTLHAHRSFAYPEVRERKLGQIAEVCAYPFDGLNLDFLRHPPYVGYDKPLTDAFAARYGVDPHTLPEDDERWIGLMGETMTGFLRDIRGTAAGKQISVRVDHREYRQQGLDIAAWIDEGLIDILIVAQRTLGGYTIDLAPFKRLTAGKCLLLFGEESICSGHDLTVEEDRKLKAGEPVDVSRRRLTVAEYAQRAADWFVQGADGIHVFNDPYVYDLAPAIHGLPERDETGPGTE